MSDRSSSVIAALRDIELPTLGHFLEQGFCSPRIRRMSGSATMIGTAVTLDLVEPDAVAVNRALVALRPGDVLVIRTGGGRHASVGAVTVTAAVAAGAAGIVVDGPVTDLPALVASGLAVYADGTTALTTKLLDSPTAVRGGEVVIGDVVVRSGDIVAGDENGVVVLDPHDLDLDVLDRARASDRAEPAVLERITAGEPLDAILNLRRA